MRRPGFAVANALGLFAALIVSVAPCAWGQAASGADDGWPHLMGSAPSRDAWDRFLSVNKLEELKAPPGGRAYRWLWINEVATNITPMPSVGYVEVIINANGAGWMKSVWRRQPTLISAADVEPFETALARSIFQAMPSQDPSAANWVDYPPEALMETVIDGHYRFVHRIGGFREETGVRQAGLLLEALAQR
jgi:hypothetical protein